MGVIEKLKEARDTMNKTLFPDSGVFINERTVIMFTKDEIDEFFKATPIISEEGVTKLECKWVTEFDVPEYYVTDRMAQELAKKIKPEITVETRKGEYVDMKVYNGSISIPTKYVMENKGEE